MNIKRTVLIVFILLAGLQVWAQQTPAEFYSESLRNMNTGMYVLGSWAILNMATGAYGMTTTEGSTKYFHQMNLFWNTVNLGIAGFALYNNLHTDVSLLSDQQIMDKHFKSEKLFLINAGLDVVYMAGGAFMVHKSKSSTKRPDLLKGYGNSVILQGGFLLVFDAAMYFIQHAHSNRFLENLQVGFTPQSIQLTLNF